MPVLGTLDNPRQHVPVLLWADPAQVEPEALNQLRQVASLPFVFHHVAVMADVHTGIGSTIGAVFATRGAVIPAAVGVDIGCGMMAVKTPLDGRLVQERAAPLRRAIEEAIPLGFDGNPSLAPSVESWPGWRQMKELPYLDQALQHKAQSQMGSLGGGNHFIEICLDEQGAVWAMLHSGSRGVGNKLAMRHIQQAKGLLRQSLEQLPHPDLAYLAEGTQGYRDYMATLDWCQRYALQNRVEMMARVLRLLGQLAGDGHPPARLLEVNCHHNYAAHETHYGQKVLVTRKGAVHAGLGQLGIIPGSMGAQSHIVRGLGSAESFNSCSHGAGRRMSRTQAKKQFTAADLAAQTQGVECRKDRGVVDEIPAAYKDIRQVMANQADLVEVVATLRQILCVKG